MPTKEQRKKIEKRAYARNRRASAIGLENIGL